MLLPEMRGEKPALFHPPELTPGQQERLGQIWPAFYSHVHGDHNTVLTPTVGGLRYKDHAIEREFPYRALSSFVREVETESNLSRETVFTMMGEYEYFLAG